MRKRLKKKMRKKWLAEFAAWLEEREHYRLEIAYAGLPWLAADEFVQEVWRRRVARELGPRPRDGHTETT